MRKKLEQQITIENEKKARLKIKKIFKKLHSKDGNYRGFRILDRKDTRLKIEGYTRYEKGHYKCVTARYIQKMILKEKYSLKLVNFILLDLLFREEIKSFFCKDIQKLIFHKLNWFGTRTADEIANSPYYRRHYNKALDDYDLCMNILSK